MFNNYVLVVALGVNGDNGTQQVHATCLQPFTGPTRKVPPTRCFQFGKEVAQLRISPSVLGEVNADSSHELGFTHPGNQLAQGRCTLGVGDAVEIHTNGVKVNHVSCNRVR